MRRERTADFTAQFRVPATLKDGTYHLQTKGAQSASVALDVASNAGPATGAGSTVVVEEHSRPLGEVIGLIALFGVLSGLGLFFARTVWTRSA